VVAAPESELDAFPSPPSAVRRRERGYWSEAWVELRHDRAAMVGLAIVVLLVLAALAAPLIAPYDPDFQHREGLTLEGQPLPPSSTFKLGTDGLGRDELSRLLYGARVSLTVGIGANVIAAIIGILVGGLAGLAGPRLQTFGMRAVDVVLSFPVLLLAIALLAVAQPSVTTITLIIGVSFGAYLSRLVFTQVVSLREREFVLAARTSGVGAPTILVRHVVPHVIPSVLVYCALGIATAVQLEAALSYVGIGIQVPTASWGNMIAEGQPYLTTAPWLVIFPGAAIVLTMVGFSLLGDGLRDALDPTLERRFRIRMPGRGR
jgi:peptide/nickel transport system permease protein